MAAISTIRSSLKDLAVLPERGRHFDDEYREWPVPFGKKGYLVLHRITHEQVVIVAVKHQAESSY